MSIKEKAIDGISKVKTYWKTPPAGRYMTFKEIVAYSGGGIGAYLIVCMSIPCILGATNVFLSGVIGIGLTDMYVMYVISVLSSIPLTGLRANIIDNTRNKAGKYRPYLLRMGIPCSLIFVAMVWFPYSKLSLLVGEGDIFGKPAAYVAKCAIVLLFNIALQFFYYFFYDAYENLIHVLSPNSQERADVASIKSVIYSFGPTVYNIIIPLIAMMFGTNQTDIKVYRFAFPIIGVIGTLLLFIVYANTQEKIVQAKTHVVQIKFVDALRAVARNKYFWIISLAGWLGFLESAYANILYWLCNYGGACSNATYTVVTTVYGNASLWGMLMAPFAIRKWGKKKVQIVTNVFNIIFILCMYPFFMNNPVDQNGNLNGYIIWAIMACLWLNALVGSFAHILNPSIQADIRDYQQYKTGERIDGMFAAVATIGSVITLVTASVLPSLQEKMGMNVAKAAEVTSNSALMSRILPGTDRSIGTILAEQLANGQDNFTNPSSALYDVEGVLIPLIKILVIVAAIGATMNVIPYLFYDFTERKQKSVVRVLKIRAMFEDYGNGVLDDGDLVEAVDYIRTAREMQNATPKALDKKSYKSVKDKAQRKAAKKLYKEDAAFNEEIEIAKFVCDELDKFETEEFKYRIEQAEKTYSKGLNGIYNCDMAEAVAQLHEARAMAIDTPDKEAVRKAAIEIAKLKISAVKTINKHFKDSDTPFVEPKYSDIEKCFHKEDAIDEKIKETHIAIKEAQKTFSKYPNEKNALKVDELKAKLKKLIAERKAAKKATKEETDRLAMFNRAAKPYIESKKLVEQKANYNEFERISEQYEISKERHERELARKAAEEARKKKEEESLNAKIKAEKLAKKEAKKAAKVK